MLCYQELYGADRDGNRGVIITNAELEPSDSDEIREQLLDRYEPGINLYTVTLYCEQFDTEHEFEVDARDYLEPHEMKD